MALILDDELLARRFNQGDESAFDRIVEEYSADIAVLANRLLAWPCEVEDIVQDVCITVQALLLKYRKPVVPEHT